MIEHNKVECDLCGRLMYSDEVVETDLSEPIEGNQAFMCRDAQECNKAFKRAVD